MVTVVLIIHIMLALGLIGVVLLQRSEGGALGIGGGGGGFMTGRGAANFLTRVTAGLAAAFFATSLVLSIMAAQPGQPSILDTPVPGAPPSQSRPTQAPPQAPPSSGLPQINLTPGGGTEAPKIPQSK